MRILFIDPSGWQYTPATPYERPLGGSQSALCYLAAELARLGHSVAIRNGTVDATESHGVKISGWNPSDAQNITSQFDVGVVVNSAIGLQLRRECRVKIPLILWTGHAFDQAMIFGLRRLREQNAWDGIAFVSETQRREFERLFLVPRQKSKVLRNAVSPAFAECAETAPWFITGEAPVLFYSSTPFRGLDVLLQAFPRIHAAVPDTSLRIYSSMSVYQVPSEEDEYRPLYDLARGLDGVNYIGSVGQAQLAQDMSRLAALAYPSTFVETFCITLVEAMAVGAAVFTTNLGALPEISAGYADMVDWQADKARLADSFADMVIGALRAMRRNPEAAMTKRKQRIEFTRSHYLWPARAKEWAGWLEEVIQRANTRTDAMRL